MHKIHKWLSLVQTIKMLTLKFSTEIYQDPLEKLFEETASHLLL